MEAIQTWRELLGKVIADPQERQRIADALGVNPITLTRWATNKSNPRQDNLRPLFEALPQHRQLLTELIAQEFPQFITEALTQESIAPTIPSEFYAQVLSVHTTSPTRLRVSTMRLLILQQIIAHLDPHQEGLLAIIAQCVPPKTGCKVRSMHMTYGRSTPAWGSVIENRILFFGAESQMGQAVGTAQPVIVNTPEVREMLFPMHDSPFDTSSLAYPLLQADRAAGCLAVASRQPHYFTQERLELIQEYAHLLVLAFEPDEFYDLQDIELGIMPSPERQQIHLMGFQRRVTQHLIQASQRNQVLSRTQAELLVWQELEEEFLHMAE
jgi:transcriptional regulator with XRE-family HTH domain